MPSSREVWPNWTISIMLTSSSGMRRRDLVSRSDALAIAAAVFNATSELGYRNVRRHPIDGGFIQQHQLVGRLADGTQIPPVEICMVIKVRDGKLISVEEYFDLSKLSAAFAH